MITNLNTGLITALNKDLNPFEDLITSFSTDTLRDNIVEHDRYPFGDLSTNVIESAFQQIYELGFLGIMLPEKCGGIGQGISTLCMMLGHISEVDASYALFVFTSSFSQEIILEAGAEDMAMKVFMNAKTAQDYLVAFPSFDDPGQIAKLPQAVSSGNGYKLTGKLEYLVLGNYSKWAIIPAGVNNKPGYSFFLVNLNDTGVNKSDPIFSLGLHACPIVDITLDGVPTQLIGKEGEGDKYFCMASKTMHVATASMSAGIMRGALKEAVEYAREREQGGRKISDWSEVSMILSNMLVKSKAADMCVSEACHAIESKIQGWGTYSMSAALIVHNMACDLVNDGVQVLGGNGYMKDYGQEKRFRDARQVQALLGSVPLRKLSLVKEAIAQ